MIGLALVPRAIRGHVRAADIGTEALAAELERLAVPQHRLEWLAHSFFRRTRAAHQHDQRPSLPHPPSRPLSLNSFLNPGSGGRSKAYHPDH